MGLSFLLREPGGQSVPGNAWQSALLGDCLSAAILVAAVWLLFRAFPHVPAAVRCLVWWVLCLKMVVSLFWMPAPLKMALLPAAKTAPIGQASRLRASRADAPPSDPAALLPAIRRAAQRLSPPWPVLKALWLGGVALLLTLLAGQFLKAKRLMERARIAPPGRCWDAVTQASAALGLRRTPRVLVSLQAVSPMTAGLLHPVVLLPGKDALSLTDEELLMVLTHELAHIRRRDLWMGLVPALAQALLFFHPLVWLAYREYLSAREEACDALALRATNLPAEQYGKLLVRFGALRGNSGAAVALGGSQAIRSLRRRLAMLQGITPMTTHQKWVWSAGLGAFGLLCLTPIALTQRQQPLLQAARARSADKPAPESSPPIRDETALARSEPSYVSRIFVRRKPGSETANRLAPTRATAPASPAVPAALTRSALAAAQGRFPHSVHVAPGQLARIILIADDSVPALTQNSVIHLAQAQVDIHELPMTEKKRALQDRSKETFRYFGTGSDTPIPAMPPLRVSVPPIPAIHVTIPPIPAIHVDVPAIPAINVNIPAPPIPPIKLSSDYKISPEERECNSGCGPGGSPRSRAGPGGSSGRGNARSRRSAARKRAGSRAGATGDRARLSRGAARGATGSAGRDASLSGQRPRPSPSPDNEGRCASDGASGAGRSRTASARRIGRQHRWNRAKGVAKCAPLHRKVEGGIAEEGEPAISSRCGSQCHRAR